MKRLKKAILPYVLSAGLALGSFSGTGCGPKSCSNSKSKIDTSEVDRIHKDIDNLSKQAGLYNLDNKSQNNYPMPADYANKNDILKAYNKYWGEYGAFLSDLETIRCKYNKKNVNEDLLKVVEYKDVDNDGKKDFIFEVDTKKAKELGADGLTVLYNIKGIPTDNGNNDPYNAALRVDFRDGQTRYAISLSNDNLRFGKVYATDFKTAEKIAEKNYRFDSTYLGKGLNFKIGEQNSSNVVLVSQKSSSSTSGRVKVRSSTGLSGSKVTKNDSTSNVVSTKNFSLYNNRRQVVGESLDKRVGELPVNVYVHPETSEGRAYFNNIDTDQPNVVAISELYTNKPGKVCTDVTNKNGEYIGHKCYIIKDNLESKINEPIKVAVQQLPGLKEYIIELKPGEKTTVSPFAKVRVLDSDYSLSRYSVVDEKPVEARVTKTSNKYSGSNYKVSKYGKIGEESLDNLTSKDRFRLRFNDYTLKEAFSKPKAETEARNYYTITLKDGRQVGIESSVDVKAIFGAGVVVGGVTSGVVSYKTGFSQGGKSVSEHIKEIFVTPECPNCPLPPVNGNIIGGDAILVSP